jgi:hypothetical protein
MISSSSSNSGPAHPPDSRYLFSNAGLGSPLEELHAIYDKKLRTAQNLGENEKANAYREAYELAAKRLAASLGVELGSS